MCKIADEKLRVCCGLVLGRYTDVTVHRYVNCNEKSVKFQLTFLCIRCISVYIQ